MFNINGLILTENCDINYFNHIRFKNTKPGPDIFAFRGKSIKTKHWVAEQPLYFLYNLTRTRCYSFKEKLVYDIISTKGNRYDSKDKILKLKSYEDDKCIYEFDTYGINSIDAKTWDKIDYTKIMDFETGRSGNFIKDDIPLIGCLNHFSVVQKRKKNYPVFLYDAYEYGTNNKIDYLEVNYSANTNQIWFENVQFDKSVKSIENFIYFS